MTDLRPAAESRAAGLAPEEFLRVAAAARELEAFLLARLDECEALARQLASAGRSAESKVLGRHEPAGILRAVASWRRIVEDVCREPVNCCGLIQPTMRYLAQEFRDHPDYNEDEWGFP